MSMDDMLYDVARDAAREAADEVRDELRDEIRDLQDQLAQACEGSDDRIESLDLLKRDLDDLVDAVHSLKQSHNRMHEARKPGVVLEDGTGMWYPQDAPALITNNQRHYIFALLADVSRPAILSRHQRIDIVNHIIGADHAVLSFTQLTEAEADQVITHLVSYLDIVQVLA